MKKIFKYKLNIMNNKTNINKNIGFNFLLIAQSYGFWISCEDPNNRITIMSNNLKAGDPIYLFESLSEKIKNKIEKNRLKDNNNIIPININKKK